MNSTARRRPLNDAFKHSQPLPQLQTTEVASGDSKSRAAKSAKPAAGGAKQSRHVEDRWASIRHSFARSLAFGAAFCLLVAVCLVAPNTHEVGLPFPGSRAGMNARPELPPSFAAWANPWHRYHHPWNAFPTHHLPAPPANPSINI